MTRYDGPVADGLLAVNRLERAMTSDLREGTVGFTWWADYPMPAETLGWLSHYLTDAVGAIAINLRDAAVHLTKYDDAVRRENIFFARRRRSSNGVPNLADRSGVDDLRLAEIVAERAGFFRAVGSVLDTLAAVVVGVGAIDINVVKADWGTLNTADTAPTYPRTSGERGRRLRNSLAGTDTDGGIAQDQLLRAVRAAIKAAGPVGWETWALATRNGVVHRARWSEFLVQVDKHNPEAGTYWLLPRQPELVEGYELQRVDSLPEVALTEDAAITMRGVLGSVTPVVQAVTAECKKLWERRRLEPRMLPQPHGEWLPPPAPPFVGYKPGAANAALAQAKTVHVGPGQTIRISALFRPQKPWQRRRRGE
ncbi:hypothetical protein [Nocardia neocaledoniensis]|uniref:hypothetical protein n=1 Tax=Nocardia neocaledoniensis TaxID=236511 RepID=UPI0024581654|nr:hypothetical protein [Nocardia neocaledoniensis]